MEEQRLADFANIAEFLDKLDSSAQGKVYKSLNEFILSYLETNPIKTISYEHGTAFSKNDNSFETFLRRAVYAFFQKHASEDNDIETGVTKPSLEFNCQSGESHRLQYLNLNGNTFYRFASFLTVETSRAILNCLRENIPSGPISGDTELFSTILELCRCTCVNKTGEKIEEDKQKNQIVPLDFIITAVSRYSKSVSEEQIDSICPFIDMNKNNFLDPRGAISDEEIYSFLNQIPSSHVKRFLQDEHFVNALGGIGHLRDLLAINNLEKSNDKNAWALARELRDRTEKIDFSEVKIEDGKEKTRIKIIGDEDYKQKVKKLFVMHQLRKSVASAFIFLFGFGLLFATGFVWSVPFLLGIGFLISSGAAFTNSILCMKPTKTRTWLAKIFKDCAWIIDGALLITLGAVFCAGPLAIAFITFGSLGILMGCFNAFVGTLNSMWDTQREMADSKKTEHYTTSIKNIKLDILSHKIFTLVVFAVACAAGVLLALNPAILPIALPFLPAIGIGIAVLSGLGVIKSALRLFYDDSGWQVGFYHAAKYIKAGMFVLGGLGLIALPFLPITTALASVIGMPTLVVNIFSFLVGLASGVKGCMSFTRMSSNIKFLLAEQAMQKSEYDITLPEKPINIEKWKQNLHFATSQFEPKFKTKFGDISNSTLKNIFPK